MPLAGGYSRSPIGKNIKAEMRAGRPRGQAVAIALSKARREALRRGKRPHALFGTPSARRFLRSKRQRRMRHARRR